MRTLQRWRLRFSPFRMFLRIFSLLCFLLSIPHTVVAYNFLEQYSLGGLSGCLMEFICEIERRSVGF